MSRPPLQLIDSSAWILALRRAPNRAVLERVARSIADLTAATCGMVLQEVLDGAATEAEFARLEADLQALTYLSADEADWLAAARLAFHLRRRGLTIKTPDLLIAALALRHEATILHLDAHYEEIAALTRDHADYRGRPLRTESLLPLGP